MGQHISHRGVPIDIDSISRTNGDTVALGNMGVNARGDQISSGMVTRLADDIAREKHRVVTAVSRESIKAPVDESEIPTSPIQKAAPKPRRPAEKTLPSGDIIIGDE